MVDGVARAGRALPLRLGLSPHNQERHRVSAVKISITTKVAV